MWYIRLSICLGVSLKGFPFERFLSPARIKWFGVISFFIWIYNSLNFLQYVYDDFSSFLCFRLLWGFDFKLFSDASFFLLGNIIVSNFDFLTFFKYILSTDLLVRSQIYIYVFVNGKNEEKSLWESCNCLMKSTIKAYWYSDLPFTLFALFRQSQLKMYIEGWTLLLFHR